MYLTRVLPAVTALLEDRKPEQVFYLAGVDVLEDDKLGRLSLSREGCKERDRLVLQACADRDVPVAVSMGGGYAPRLATIIEAHVNTYRVARSIFG